LEPDHVDPPPLDLDIDYSGRTVTVAPPTRRFEQPGGIRPLKGGYWFVRERYRDEVQETIAQDKERLEKKRQEKEEEQEEGRLRLLEQEQFLMEPRQASPPPLVSPSHSILQSPLFPQSFSPQFHSTQTREYQPQIFPPMQEHPGSFPGNIGSGHYMRYPPPR
jgi:hypothetical protein